MRLDYGDGPLFADRFEAGAQLGARVREMSWPDPVVLGMARGGVPVAAAVAEILDAPLDVAVARKIGAPGRPEFGVGAVTAEGPARYDESTLAALGLTPADLLAACERERAEARRRLARYRDNAEALPVTGRDVLLVDDGLVTGVTARAALGELCTAGPRRMVFAAPVCARTPRPRCAPRLMMWCVWPPRPGSVRSATGTATSARPPMRKYSPR